MRRIDMLFFCICLSAQVAIASPSCFEDFKSNSPGKVTFEIINKTCTEDEKNQKTCIRSLTTVTDECKDPKTLLKHYCDTEGKPAEKNVSCNCQDGICKK
jgi:hypothetical protein